MSAQDIMASINAMREESEKTAYRSEERAMTSHFAVTCTKVADAFVAAGLVGVEFRIKDLSMKDRDTLLDHLCDPMQRHNVRGVSNFLSRKFLAVVSDREDTEHANLLKASNGGNYALFHRRVGSPTSNTPMYWVMYGPVYETEE